MATTLKKEIEGVRSFLGDPLDQFPSTRDILEELEAEYQNIANVANNTGLAWSIDELVLETVANQFDYNLSAITGMFHKAVQVEILPTGIELSSEVDGKDYIIDYTNSKRTALGTMEFTEIEHFPADYQWLQTIGGELFFNQKFGFYMAFYRQIHKNVGETYYVRLAPIPTTTGVQIKIMYQTTDWFDNLFETLSTETENYQQRMPHSSHRMLMRALTAKNLVYKSKVKWSNNKKENDEASQRIILGLNDKINRYKPAFDQYILTLQEDDTTIIVPWDNGEYR